MSTRKIRDLLTLLKDGRCTPSEELTDKSGIFLFCFRAAAACTSLCKFFLFRFSKQHFSFTVVIF